MNQHVQEQFEQVKKTTLDNLGTISTVMETAESLSELAKKVDNKRERIQLEKKANTLISTATALHEQNKALFSSYVNLASTALKNK